MASRKTKETSVKVIFNPNPDAIDHLGKLYDFLLSNVSEKGSNSVVKVEQIQIKSTADR